MDNFYYSCLHNTDFFVTLPKKSNIPEFNKFNRKWIILYSTQFDLTEHGSLYFLVYVVV